MPKRVRTAPHDLVAITEDLLIAGGSAWQAHCTCGWSSRHSSEAGVARGLWRRHLVLFGRGRAAHKA